MIERRSKDELEFSISKLFWSLFLQILSKYFIFYLFLREKLLYTYGSQRKISGQYMIAFLYAEFLWEEILVIVK